MEISEVRIKLISGSDEKLLAFATITIDGSFVVRDLKIIDGGDGRGLFLAMPSRKLTMRSTRCSQKNHIRAHYCNHCGIRFTAESTPPNPNRSGKRLRLHADIAHPVNADARDLIQKTVFEAYHAEQERAVKPGYVNRYDDYDAGPE
ncbi:MAG TPA: SpoVG family protein [Planctomycetota bacterium]|nr:SpoVG family protein [Planctomycetota bacterium]